MRTLAGVASGGSSPVSRSANAKPARAFTTPRSSQRSPSKRSSATGIASSTSLPTTTPSIVAGSVSTHLTRDSAPGTRAARVARCRSRSAADRSTIV